MNFFHHKHRHHHNLILFALGFLLAALIALNPGFNQFINHLGKLGYIGGFVAGILFVSTFTVATGAVILLDLAKNLSPIFLIIVAASGAVAGDFLIFKFIEDDVEGEIQPIYNEIVGSHLRKILHTKYFAWTLPVLGALIIVSPLPDELGVSLMGISTLTTSRFLLISLASHIVGMSLLIGASLVS